MEWIEENYAIGSTLKPSPVAGGFQVGKRLILVSMKQRNFAWNCRVFVCFPEYSTPPPLPPPSLSLPLHASGVGRRGTRGRRGWLLSHQVDNNAPHPGNISCSLFCLRFYLDLCQSWHDMHSIIAHSSTLVVAILLTLWLIWNQWWII